MKDIEQDLLAMGYKAETADDNSRSLMIEGDDGKIAMCWKLAEGQDDNSICLALLSPTGTLIFGAKCDVAVSALRQAETFRAMATEMTFYSGDSNKNRDSALRLDADPDFYIQIHDRMDPSGRQANYIVRSQKLRRDDPDTHGAVARVSNLVDAYTSLAAAHEHVQAPAMSC